MVRTKQKQKSLRRGGKNTQKKCTKKVLMTWVTHLESDILECEVKCALGSITVSKASGGEGIPAELLQILKDDAVKVLHSVCKQVWKTQLWTQDQKTSDLIPIPKKGNTKECSDHHTVVLIQHASKVMLKTHVDVWQNQYNIVK